MKYRDKLEQEFSNTNTKQAFQRVKQLTVQEQIHHHFPNLDPLNFADPLKTFFNRFDTHDHTPACEELFRACPFQEPHNPPCTQENVQQELARCKINKASGTDGIPASVLKLCAMEPSPIFHTIF